MIKRSSPTTGAADGTPPNGKNGHGKNGKHSAAKNTSTKNTSTKKSNGKNGTGKKSIATTGTIKLTFVLPADVADGNVSVLGDFNHWDPLAHPLKRRSNGTRSATVEIPRGTTVAFKYLDESGRWFCDPDLPEAAVNEYGETNSIVTT